MNNNKNKKATPKGKKNAKGNGNGRIYAPVAQTRLMKTGVPKVSGSAYTSDGRIRVQHREYIADVAGSVGFSATAYAVNPGLQGTFPWLAPISAQFESYLIRGLSFEFETQKSTATSGSIMMAIDYDASDAAPSNKQQLMSYHDAVRSAVWNECCFRADIRDLQKFGIQRYLRSGVLSANQDIKTFDIGNLIIATQGCADTTAIGELYVIYDIELITPQSDAPRDVLTESAKIVNSANADLSHPFGTAAATVTGGLPCSATNGVLTFNRVGEYLLEQIVVGTVLATLPTIAGTATYTTIVDHLVNAAATYMVNSYIIKINNVGETISFDFTGHATTVSGTTCRIGSYSYAIA